MLLLGFACAFNVNKHLCTLSKPQDQNGPIFFAQSNKFVDASSMPDPILGTRRRIQFLEQTFMEQKLEAIMKIQKNYKGDRFNSNGEEFGKYLWSDLWDGGWEGILVKNQG